MKGIIFVAAVVVLSAHHLLAVEPGTGVELPKGAPIPVLVEHVPPDAEKFGLTREYIRTQVDLRLRRNGLTPKESTNEDYYVYINVNVVGPAFSWRVGFTRVVYYRVEGKWYRGGADTYSKGGMGTHARGREFIMDSVLAGLDTLCNEIHKSFK